LEVASTKWGTQWENRQRVVDIVRPTVGATTATNLLGSLALLRRMRGKHGSKCKKNRPAPVVPQYQVVYFDKMDGLTHLMIYTEYTLSLTLMLTSARYLPVCTCT